MKTRILAVCVSLFAGLLFANLPEDYLRLKEEAEARFAEGSYAKAHELYQQAMEMSNITSNEARWVWFRKFDTQWRSASATERADTTTMDEAFQALDKMVRDVEREEEKDRIWAEVQESLGDYHWTRRQGRNWHQAWQHYQQALDWWAGQSDLDEARTRYLAIVWRGARPPQVEPYYRYGYHGNYLPLPILENAQKIAQADEDRAHAHYLIAMTLRNQGGRPEQRQRVAQELEAAIQLGQKTDWYDDALYHYAEWMQHQGRFVPLEDGGCRQEADYVKALALFRQLVREYSKGETRYWDQAQQQIKSITGPDIGVHVSHIFLPGSEIQYHVNWRNVKRVKLALYRVDLTRDVVFSAEEKKSRTHWLHTIQLSGRKKLKEWTHDTEDNGKHKPGRSTLRYDGRLKRGAYVLEVRSGGNSSRDLVLVTDATVVLKTSGRQALVYVCDALNGAPLSSSDATLWARWREDDHWRKHSEQKQTDKDGLAVFELPDAVRNMEVFVGARQKDRQAFSTGNSHWRRRDSDSWKIYAFTDRPAYRPKETVHWKFTARRYNGSVYSTPAKAVVEFEITDPRGSKVSEGKATLNEFGSAWGSLDLTDKMPLGEYRIRFRDEQRERHIGNATLFRLEEYKLPEFKVTVSTPEESGAGDPPGPPRKKAFRLGDTVEAIIQADYYFGGPVANANVEVVVYKNPFWMVWPQPREFPWFYHDMDEGRQRWRRGWGGSGQIVKREVMKTDATGRVTLTIETDANSSQDLEYRIEARVTDASRREIVGNGTLRVTRQRYYVNARAQHNLYRPQDKVTVEFRAQDANENPFEVEGKVKVTRQYWWEIWIKPDGTEVKGDELKRLRGRHPIWPPAPERPDQKGWRLKFRGYEQDDVLTRSVKTDTNGVAELSFTPEREGYYRLAWTSEDAISNPQSPISNLIRTETTVWVADNESTDIGYRHGGVEIIADKDTFRVGNEAPVMLVANSGNRYVLFTVEGEDLQSYRLVHLTGTVKLIHLLMEEQHVPNIFLGAVMVSDRQIFMDTKQVVVPPIRNFLTVEVQSDRDQYQPREEGTLTVTTRNDEGQPVSAEVALSLVDESVFYIQEDYAGDPRQFFFGTKRPHRVQTQSTMNQKSYAKLIETEGDLLQDEREVESAKREREEERMAFGYADGLRASAGVGGAFQMNALAEMAAPASTTMPMLAKAARPAGAVGFEDKEVPVGLDESGEPESEVVVRSDFRSTILWQPEVKTDADGTATVKVKYPDSVTSWKATARAVTSGNQFGIADATTRTKQPLIVRLQAPRFFVVGDEVVLSAVVNNNTDEEMDVKVSLDVEGGLADAEAGRDVALAIPANGEARADWTAVARQPGDVMLKVTARGGKHADAMEKTYLVYEHGIEKFITKAGKVRGEDITLTLDIPSERKPESTSLTVQVTPSLAVTMLDALPYMIDYPYGCTEQTMSRFLPAVITAKTLEDLGLQPEDVMSRVFGGIEQSTAGQTHPNGKKDLQKLNEMMEAGLQRLYDFQHSDGGWGWWKKGDSDHWMTAYVVWGLSLARQAEVKVDASVLRRGVTYLNEELVEEEERPDMQSWMLHALAVYKASQGETGLSEFEATTLDNLWKKRDSLNAYTRALFALAAHHFGQADKARILIANLENGVIRDDRPDASVLIGGKPDNAAVMGTAHWGEDGLFWRWSDGGVEATAFALRALLAIDPDNELIEPVTNWLIKNRRGAQWSNTRDTAIVVLTMNDYLRASGELQPQMEFELFVNGESLVEKEVRGADVFDAPSRFTVDPGLIRDGANEIRILRKSEGPIYFAVEAAFFSLEEPIPPAGNEIFVKRDYYKLVGRPTLLKGYVYDRMPLEDGETVQSGERVETVITIEAKNYYEYLVFEDLKPAGFEAVAIRSGESLYARELRSGATAGQSAIRNPQSAMDFTGRTRWVYQELRDRKVALFIDKLPEGYWQIRYDCRARFMRCRCWGTRCMCLRFAVMGPRCG